MFTQSIIENNTFTNNNHSTASEVKVQTVMVAMTSAVIYLELLPQYSRV